MVLSYLVWASRGWLSSHPTTSRSSLGGSELGDWGFPSPLVNADILIDLATTAGLVRRGVRGVRGDSALRTYNRCYPRCIEPNEEALEYPALANSNVSVRLRKLDRLRISVSMSTS